MEFKFKNLSTRELVPNISDYYNEILTKHPFIDVYVSTDSQARYDRLVYATVIGFHMFDQTYKGKGASVLYSRYTLPRNLYGKAARYDYAKLYSETAYSLDVAKYLESLGIKVQYIELDYNMDEKYFSNKVLLDAINEVKANGFDFTCKPNAMLTYAADKLSKK